MAGWLAGRSAGWLLEPLAGWLAGWLADQLAGRLSGWNPRSRFFILSIFLNFLNFFNWLELQKYAFC